jgi:hypothetical protein
LTFVPTETPIAPAPSPEEAAASEAQATSTIAAVPEASELAAPRMEQSVDEFEEAFEQAQRVEARRRHELKRRTANRSRARQIVKTEKRGRVRFSVLAVCLTATVVVVTVVMFETLAWLVGG